MSDTPAPSSPPAPGPAPGGVRGMAADASTLASTGLLCAVLFAVVAGIINSLGDPSGLGMQGRLLALTETVDVGDVALLGIAVALLLLTPDPPGGVDRPRLLRLNSALAWIIAAYGVVRAFVLVIQDTDMLHRSAGFVATIGVAIAAATVGYYAARESFLKQEGRI